MTIQIFTSQSVFLVFMYWPHFHCNPAFIAYSIKVGGISTTISCVKLYQALPSCFYTASNKSWGHERLGRRLEFIHVCSFPPSGPKRYDIIDGRWRYSHDRDALHDLLSREFSKALGSTVDLSGLEYSNIATDGDSWA